MEQGHEQVLLRPAPEGVRLAGPGGILVDGVGHGLHQVSLLIQGVQAVPAILVGHIQEVDGLEVVTLLADVGRKLFKEFSLGVCDKDGLAPLGTAH